MHTALYRKFRPKTFFDIVGQKYVVAALKNQISNSKIGHAFLFTGTRGTGKTSCAKIFAKAINCQNPKNGEPCLECDICIGIENETIYDVTEMDAASNNSVEDIRDLLEEVMYLPVMAKYRVYIIDEVHMLSTAAFNALLKTLEEPPAHVVFILATTEIHKVPATILSRCQKYDFNKLTVGEIGDNLMQIAQNENINLSFEAAKMIASLADGAMRDGLSILETCIASSNEVTEDVVSNIVGVSKDDEIFNLSKEIINKDLANSLRYLLEIEQKSVDLKRLCEELITHFRNLLLAGIEKTSGELLNISDEKFEKLKNQAKTSNTAFISFVLSKLTNSLEEISQGQNPKIAMDIALFNICSIENIMSIPVPVYENKPLETKKETSNINQTANRASIKNEMQTEKTQIDNTQKQTKTFEKKPIDNLQEEKPIEFIYWKDVIASIQKVDIPFYHFIKESKGWLYKNVVYIQGSEGLNNYIRTNKETAGEVKRFILEACGTSYNIGGYKNIQNLIEPPKEDKLDQILALENNGVKININDN